ncbi:MAG: SH3 domain-containing protein [Anaerolineales bacterium]|nr:SH3 domain-containing protein [Anaerolineales bacterium]
MLQRLSTNPILFFLLALALSLGAAIPFAATLQGLSTHTRIIAIIAAITTSITMMILRTKINWQSDEKTLLLINAFATLGLTFAASVGIEFLSPESQNPLPDIADRVNVMETRIANIESRLEIMEGKLEAAGLTEEQRQDIGNIILDSGEITLDDLSRLGLNQTQMEQVRAILSEAGFLTEGDISNLLTAEANKATAAAVGTAAATCYIKPLDGYPRINIRRTPRQETGNEIGLLSQGEQLPVIGHNGGTINNDLWWLVKLPNRDENNQYGWIFSGVVHEINPSACVELDQYPTE